MEEETLREGVGESPLVEVSNVRLDSFRNYRSLFLSIDPGFNVLAGPNAQGKTNFLEALYLVATTRLLRGKRDAEAILDDGPQARVDVEMGPSATKLSVTLSRGLRKRVMINDLGMPRAADLIGRLPCVCVASGDMAIVQGEPGERRLFLDLELSALYPAYLRHLTFYKRALEQRSALLRDAREHSIEPAAWEPWEEQMAVHGSAIRQARREFLARLSPHLQAVHARMGEGEELRASYLERDEAVDEDVMRIALESSRRADVARGGTSIGPHRDDLLLEVGGREARLFGSQGQQRTSVISIKMATLVHAKEVLGAVPLLLLDDILSDLDESRRSLLVEVVLENAGQAVLTCTEAAAAGQRILERAKVFEVCAGKVVPV